MRCIRLETRVKVGLDAMSAWVVQVFTGRNREAAIGASPEPTAYCRGPALDRAVVTGLGISGNQLATPRSLGVENHAVYLFHRDHYAAFEAELGRPLEPGAFAENILYSGPFETDIRIGDVFEIGDVRLQVTTPRVPCYKMRHFLQADQGFPARFSASGRTGFYTRVVRPGAIRVGDRLVRVTSDERNASVYELNEALTQFSITPELLDRVLASPELLPGAADKVRQHIADSKPELGQETLSARIVERVRISDDTAILKIAGDKQPLHSAMPGQFITLGIGETRSGSALRYRCYSLIDAPTSEAPERPYAIAVRRDPGKTPENSVSAQLTQTDVSGRAIRLFPPAGDFLPPRETDAPLLYIAGGIGVTPILSHLRALSLRKDPRDIRLIYACKSMASAVFLDEIAHLADRLPNFDYTLYLTGEPTTDSPKPVVAGRPDIRSLVSSSQDTHVFVCGPLSLITSVREAHSAADASPQYLHFELFEDAGDLSFDTEPVSAATVAVQPWKQSLAWRPDDGSLLDLIESRSEYRPPAACRSGLCRTCKATLVEGDVVYPTGINHPARDAVLLCCARPATSRIVVELPSETPRITGETK